MLAPQPTRYDALPRPDLQIERVRGSDAARVVYEVTYLDANLRITRCGRQLMIHRRA